MIRFELKILLDWSSYSFEISLMLEFISSSSHSKVKTMNLCCFSKSTILSLTLILVDYLEDFFFFFFFTKSTKMFDAMLCGWMPCMHPYLFWKHRSPHFLQFLTLSLDTTLFMCSQWHAGFLSHQVSSFHLIPGKKIPNLVIRWPFF